MCTAGPGWRGSSHSATSVRLSPRPDADRSAMGLDHLSRNLRTHTRREEPAHGAVEVPFDACRLRLSRARRGTLPEPVSGRNLRRDGTGGAGADEPALQPEARVLAALLRERDEHGARRCRPD